MGNIIDTITHTHTLRPHLLAIYIFTGIDVIHQKNNTPYTIIIFAISESQVKKIVKKAILLLQ
jgi:hypothetical protein